MIRNKTIKFNLDKPDDRELWELLQKLPHGKFSEATKNYWKSLTEKVKYENSPERLMYKEFHEQKRLLENPWIAEMRKG
jgi:hypothetical protein